MYPYTEEHTTQVLEDMSVSNPLHPASLSSSSIRGSEWFIYLMQIRAFSSVARKQSQQIDIEGLLCEDTNIDVMSVLLKKSQQWTMRGEKSILGLPRCLSQKSSAQSWTHPHSLCESLPWHPGGKINVKRELQARSNEWFNQFTCIYWAPAKCSS